MAELSYPFESQNIGTAAEPVYDRAITAENERTFNKLRYTNGVFSSVGSGLSVSSNNNMTVTVGTGGAHVEGALYYNSAPINLAVEAANASLNRIDRVVLQFNTSVSVRSVRVLIRTGTAATNPVAPELRQESNLYEIALADVYVGKGKTSIAQSAITDQRLNSELCGMVVAAIPTAVDTTGLYDQYQASLDEWLDTVAAALDETLAGQLSNQISALDTRLTAEEAKIQPVSKGGTGATTAAVARTNLGVKACGTYDTLPVAKGGTGATTAAAALENLGGTSWTKIWENASPTSAFKAQTLNSSVLGGTLTGKTPIRIEWEPSTAGGERFFLDSTVDADMLCNFISNGNANAVPVIRTRNVKLRTAGIEFDDAYSKTITNDTTYVNNTASVIPVAIYAASGWKGV